MNVNKKGVSLDHGLQSVKVETPDRRRDSNPEDSYAKRLKSKKRASKSSDFVYVNNAYVGSLNSVNETRIAEPPTSVIREQYWTCSKWPLGQKILALAVGILLGAVIGLGVTMIFRAAAPDVDIPGGILRSAAAPD